MPEHPAFKHPRGAAWATSGELYQREAEDSARSLRAKMPGLPCFLVTDKAFPPTDAFDEVIIVEDMPMPKMAKLYCERVPCEQVLFLDSDTLVCHDLSELFGLLARFDIAAQNLSSGYHYKLEGVPESFPEYGSGVFLWKNNDKTRRLFEAWRDQYLAFWNEDGNKWDQKSFRKVLWYSDCVLGPIPPEYNFNPYWPMFAMIDLMVVHGRPQPLIKRMEREMNRRNGLRVWHPDFGCINETRKLELWQMVRLLGRVSWVLAREAWQRPLRWGKKRALRVMKG